MNFGYPMLYNRLKGWWQRVKEKLPQEILFNRQVNYIIIEKMWEYMNKGKDKQELYNLLDLNKNVYSRIRKADNYNCVNLEKRWENKNSKLRNIGLSKEIMTGQNQIKVDGIKEEDWENYLKYRYGDKGMDNYRTSAMQQVNKKLKEAFARLQADKKDKRDIGKLFYYFKYGRAVTLDVQDVEMIDLRDSLNHVSLENMKECDRALQKEVYDILKEKFRQLDIIIQYEQLGK